jgi:prephenate dehydratase
VSPIVGYPGPPGSHSGAAATAIAPERTELVALSSFTAVIEAASAA